MVTTALDQLEYDIKALKIDAALECRIVSSIKKARRDFFTNLIIRSIDAETAKSLSNEGGGIQAKIEEMTDQLFASNLPFVGIMFHILSYADWAKIQKAIVKKGLNHGG